MNLGVAIVTSGRCPQLVEVLERAWMALGAHVRIRINTDINYFARDLALAIADCPKGFAVMTSADDVLPAGTWPAVWNSPPDAIQAVRCLDVEGRGGIEWCRWLGDPNGPDGRWGGRQLYEDPADAETYISGHCQIWGSEVRQRLIPSGLHGGIDIRLCWEARRAGFRLLPPPSRDGGPLVIHLERRWPR